MYYLVVHVAPLWNDSIACIKHTPRTCCVSVVPVCKWFSVLNRERERGNECVHVSKCLSPNRADFLCSGPNRIWNGKKAQEARKIAIITEHTQFVVFLFLFRIKKNQHRNFVDQTPSFVYLHSWHWVALAVDDGVVVVGIIIVIVVAAVVAHSKHQRHAQTHILLEFL